MDALTDLNLNQNEETTTQEAQPEVVRNFATIAALHEDGVSLLFDGEEEPTQKHYLCNTSIDFTPGDRVRILADSGTYIVEYVVGKPRQTKLVGLPVAGKTAQVLTKDGDADFAASWQDPHYIPKGGNNGQALVKTSGTDYQVGWEDVEAKNGIPTGGSANQVLTKASATDYATGWATPHYIPSGGSDGQALIKNGSTNYSVEWGNPLASNGIPTGGSTNQVLVKNSSTNYNAVWANPPGIPTGGSSGQVLMKNSSYTDFSTKWADLVASNGMPTGGTEGQALVKTSATNYSTTWTFPRANSVRNQYNTGSSYDIQLRTTSTYGTPVFQIRMGTGSWYTITLA